MRRKSVIKDRRGIWDVTLYTCLTEDKAFVAIVKRHREFGPYTPWYNLTRRQWDYRKPVPRLRSAFALALRHYDRTEWVTEVLDTVNGLKAARARKTEWIQELQTVEPSGYNRKTGEYITVSAEARKRERARNTASKLPYSVHRRVLKLAAARFGTPSISRIVGISRGAVCRILRKRGVKPNGLTHPPRLTTGV